MYKYEPLIKETKFLINLHEKACEFDLSFNIWMSVMALFFAYSAYVFFEAGWFGVCIIVAGSMFYLYTVEQERIRSINRVPSLKSKLSLLNYEKDLLVKVSNNNKKYDDEELEKMNLEIKIISDLRHMENLDFTEESFARLQQESVGYSL